MKKLVISGSAKLQKELQALLAKLKDKYEILDYPKTIENKNFMSDYPKIHQQFYQNIINADTLLIFNEDKNNISGYVGSAAFAELAFGVILKLVYKKDIEIYIYKMPSENVQSYDEINLYLKLGWIKVWNE